jgi:hypothetical protein
MQQLATIMDLESIFQGLNSG